MTTWTTNCLQKITFILCLCISVTAVAVPTQPTAILVDKKTNRLHVTDYVDGIYKIRKSYHVTMGQVKGDKQEQDDLKTPEGIYVFKSHLTPPSLKAKFGHRAFYMSYPNPFDDLAGRTGFDIMLHATDTPERLKKDFDSKGCIVVKNEEIDEIRHSIQLNLTPILVFDELKGEYMSPGKHEPLKQFFANWIKAWEGKQIDPYMDHYHSHFTNKKFDKKKWRRHKNSLNQRYHRIVVKPEKIFIYRHPKYSMITFTQNYRSEFKNGKAAHLSHGTKTLYIAEELGQPKIIAEHFTKNVW